MNITVNRFLSLVMAMSLYATWAMAADGTEQYKTVIFEDFSLFTSGSEAQPQSSTVNDPLTQGIPNEKTLNPGWQGIEVHEAGGMAYLAAGGTLFTPDIDLSKNGGNFRISAKMKLASGNTSGLAYVQHSRISSQRSFRLTQQWQTVTYEFTGGVTADYLAICAIASIGNAKIPVYVDDVRIEVPAPDVESPGNVVYDSFTGTAFSLYWDAVAGAESYEVSVFTQSPTGLRSYVVEDAPVNATSYHAEGLAVNWNGYYAMVRAVSGSKRSPYTSPLLIEGLPAPVVSAPHDVTANGFTVNWNPVPSASFYQVHTYCEHTATDDEQFDIINTDFSFIKAGDTPSGIDVAFAELPGWFFGAAEFEEGAVGIQGAFAYLGYAAQIESPRLDLTASGGKVSIEFRTKNDDAGTGVTVALFAFNNGDYQLADHLTIGNVAKNWRTVTATLRGGNDNCIIAIMPSGSGNLFVDDLHVYQNIKETMTASRMVALNVVQTPSATVNGISCPIGDKIYCTVRAVGVSSDRTRNLYSENSSRVYADVNGTGSVSSSVISGASVAVDGDCIVMTSSDENSPMAVYDVNGRCLWSCTAGTVGRFVPGRPGIYLVVIGNSSRKILLR